MLKLVMATLMAILMLSATACGGTPEERVASIEGKLDEVDILLVDCYRQQNSRNYHEQAQAARDSAGNSRHALGNAQRFMGHLETALRLDESERRPTDTSLDILPGRIDQQLDMAKGYADEAVKAANRSCD